MSSSSTAASPSSLPSKPKQLSKDEFVEYFTLLRKTNPSLTAQEFFAIVHKDHEAAQQQYQQQQTAATSTNAASTTTATSSSLDATTTAEENVTPIVSDVTEPVNPIRDAAHTDSAAASASSPTSSSASPVVVNNVIRSKLFAPSSQAPAVDPAVLPTTITPDSSQASSSAGRNTGSSLVVLTPTTRTAPNGTSGAASPPDVLATTSTPPLDTGISTPPTTGDTDLSEAAAASTATTAPTINIANLKEEMDKERERLKQYIHQQNVLRYQELKREAEENARQREEIDDVYARVRPLPPPPAVALQRGAAAAGAAGGGLAAGAPPAPARRGIPERIGDGLRFLGQMDLFDMLLRYGLFALLISNGSWHVFFIIVACLCGYSIISYLLSLIEFRRGQAPQADPAAAAAPPTRQRRPQDCSTAFRVWYICFKLFLLFFVSFLPWFKVEGLRRELHYEGVLYYPEDHLAAENPAPAEGEDAAAPREEGNHDNNQGEGPVAPPMAEGQGVEEAVAAQ